METKDDENEVIIEERKDNAKEYEEVSASQNVKTKKRTNRTDSYFDGGVLELIGWKLLAFLITVVTFGIASPWAQCMLYSWQYKHTVFNGKRLKFEGTGGDLFVNIFKWIFFSIITLGIYIIFIPVKKSRWILSNLHFEDEELVENESYFDGNTLQLIGINILAFLLIFCSFGLLYPFATCLKINWGYKHSIVNRKRLVFDGNGLQLWGKTLLWTLLTIVTFGLFLFYLPIAALKWEAKKVHIKKIGEEEKKDKSLYIVIPIAIIIFIIAVTLLSRIIPNLSEEKLEEFAKTISEFIENNKFVTSSSSRYNKMLKEDNRTETIKEIKKQETPIQSKVESEQKSELEQTSIKTSITAGGYTLQFGTYYGQIEQGVWDDETMTSKSILQDVYLVLNEDTITLDGQTAGYSISGTNINWYALDFPVLEVSGNNRITYLAETCPELVYQGY